MTENVRKILTDLNEIVPDIIPGLNLHYKVLVKILEYEEKTKSGLIMPEDARERRTRAGDMGYIIKIGEDAFKAYEPSRPCAGFEVGDLVLLTRYEGMSFWYKDELYSVVNDDRIHMKIDPRIDLYDFRV